MTADTNYQRCLECTYVYPTEKSLLDAFNADRPDGVPAATDGSTIIFCPECMHDFPHPPTMPTRSRRRKRVRRNGSDADLHIPVADQLDLLAAIPLTGRTSS